MSLGPESASAAAPAGAATATIPAITRQSEARMNGMKLLIVDDNQDLRKMLRIALAPGGYQLFEAADGASAIQLANAQRPDVVLLDVTMPGALDGFRVCELIKSRPELEHALVIMLTALDGPAARNKGKRVKADHYLTKPFSLLHLLDVIASRPASGAGAAGAAGGGGGASVGRVGSGGKLSHTLSFTTDEASGRAVVRMFDPVTHELVEEVSVEAFLAKHPHINLRVEPAPESWWVRLQRACQRLILGRRLR